MEVEPTLTWLRETYPGELWVSDAELESTFDLVICADVIEHVKDPERLLDRLEELCGRCLILSTPARDLVPYVKNRLGPPLNPYHYREWSRFEFAEFVARKFDIRMQLVVGNATQVLLCLARSD